MFAIGHDIGFLFYEDGKVWFKYLGQSWKFKGFSASKRESTLESTGPKAAWTQYLYLIFVTNISVENKSVMWRNFRFLNVTDEVSPHVEQFQIYPHDRGGEIFNFSSYGICLMWRI